VLQLITDVGIVDGSEVSLVMKNGRYGRTKVSLSSQGSLQCARTNIALTRTSSALKVKLLIPPSAVGEYASHDLLVDKSATIATFKSLCIEKMASEFGVTPRAADCACVCRNHV
jgi:hypothetical protein